MNRPIWHRIGAVLCCLLFICCFGFRITVEAVFTEGVVIGGTMAATEAALGEATTVAIGSSGLTDQLREASDAAGQSVQAFVNDRIAAYNAVASGSSLLPIMAVDLMRSLTYTPDGKLIFSDEFAHAFSSFMDWMIGNGDLAITPNSDGAILENYTPKNSSWNLSNSDRFIFPVTFTGNSVDLERRGTVSNFSVSGNGKIYSFVYHVNGNNYVYVPIFVSDEEITMTSWGEGYGVPYVQSISIDGHNYYYMGGGSSNTFTFPSSINVTNGVINSVDIVKLAFNQEFSSTGSTDGLDVWNDSDDGVVVDPTSLLGDALAGLEGAIANVSDYISTLADVIAGVGNPALPVVGVGDIPISIPADITIPANPALPADRVDDVPATGEDTMPAYTGTGDYTLPLADFFPFCIPFDIYKMLSLLSADPVAPSVDYPFPLPGGGTYTIHIDLSQFDSVAQVLRTIEILAFCVGLGFATKKLLFGS